MAVNFSKSKKHVDEEKSKEVKKIIEDIPKGKKPKKGEVVVPASATASVGGKKDNIPIPEASANITELVAVPEQHAVVKVELSTTVNTGNFNSVRMMTGLNFPCPVDEANETFDIISTWVGDKLEALYNKYVEEE